MEEPSGGSPSAGAEYSPLAGSGPPWPDAAAGLKRAGIVLAVWVAVTIIAAGVTVAAYAGPNPDAHYTQEAVALGATVLALVVTIRTWARRANLKKVRCLECGAESALAAEVCARCGAALSYQQPVAAGTPGWPPGQRTTPGYSGRKSLVLAGAILVLLVALIAVIAANSSTDQLTWDQLRPGDCLAGSNMGLGNSSPWPDYVTQVACTKPHEAEVFLIGNAWPQSLAYPGESAISSQSDARCDTAFAAYDGVDSSASAFWATSIAPDSSDWASGDRSLVCVAYLPSASGPSGGKPVNYSIKGSHR